MKTREMPTEAFVRPVFQRSRFNNPPKVFTLLVSGVTTGTLDLRPPKGVLWALNYAQVMCRATGAANCQMWIEMYDGTYDPNGVRMTQNLNVAAAGDKVSWGSFGNGPLIITNECYVRLYYGGTHATSAFDLVAAVEVL
jgi:hypothetical protein